MASGGRFAELVHMEIIGKAGKKVLDKLAEKHAVWERRRCWTQPVHGLYLAAFIGVENELTKEAVNVERRVWGR